MAGHWDRQARQGLRRDEGREQEIARAVQHRQPIGKDKRVIDLDRQQHFLASICSPDVANDVGDGRRVLQIQTDDFFQCFAPWRRDKKDKRMVRRDVTGRANRSVVAMLQVDCSVQASDVALR
jgi:hypothetical protein